MPEPALMFGDRITNIIAMISLRKNLLVSPKLNLHSMLLNFLETERNNNGENGKGK